MTDPANLASPQINGVNNPPSSSTDLNIDQEPLQNRFDHSHELSQPLIEITNGNGDEHPDAPSAKRRKIVNGDQDHKASPRAISPPWKSVHAEGPTSFLENGRRRSGRTNAVPLDLQPQKKTRQTRAAYDKTADKRGKPVYNQVKKPEPEPEPEPLKHAKTPSIELSTKRGPGRPPKAINNSSASTKEVRVDVPVIKPTLQDKSPARRRSGRIPTKSKREVAHHDDDVEREEQENNISETSPRPRSPPLFLKKISFRIRLPKPVITTPANIPPPRKYGSFEKFIEQDDTEEPGVRLPWTSEQIRKEAASRLRMWQSTTPGRLPDQNVLPKQPEPPREYAHRDHFLAHMDYFRTLLRKEKREHRRTAEILANEAKKYVEEKARRGRVRTAEELAREQRDIWIGKYKVAIKDIGKMWQAVEIEVNTARLRQYEKEQQEKLKGHLNRVLDRTDAMLKRHDTEQSGTNVSDTNLDDSETDSDDVDTDDSEQISASSSESEISDQMDDPDATMTLEELKVKYNDISEVTHASAGHTSDDEASVNENTTEREEEGQDDSDPETIMDSELDTDESSDKTSEGDDNGSDDHHDGGLLSLFSKREIQEMAPADESDDEMADDSNLLDETHLIETNGEVTEDLIIDDSIGGDQTPLIQELSEEANTDFGSSHSVISNGAIEASPLQPTVEEMDNQDDDRASPSSRTSTAKTKTVETEYLPKDHPETPVLAQTKSPNTPIPSLLRGKLREYQHEGLDWLANLYASGRSGILADEMGLGKTIQSIALLAHLATKYEVWGPHLIVVPTSVMLNWEMEFKKFLPGFKILTYYGSQEERKQKRRGWMADDSFNVCITSYQLVLQDANSFKRRKWHYMILDEAHNIKNFRSERWQTMMTFNTRARLLLTGTPLQNNLTELWSLLFFLHYGQENEGEDDAFAGLREWSEWFKRPVESILEHGKQVLDREDQAQVAKLHKVIRPFLLRRLKAEVEKQMPLKYEHVEMCRLSKRQRQLYDGFMSRAQTRETLASGNYLSIINALMQLRKVCNHPDLFETRPINTSFAMPRSVAAAYEISDFLVRRRLFADTGEAVDLDFLQLAPISRESMSWIQWRETSACNAYAILKDLRHRQYLRVQGRSRIFASADRSEVMLSLESEARQARLQHIDRTQYYEAYKHHQHPVYGTGILDKVSLCLKQKELAQCALRQVNTRRWDKTSVYNSINLVQSLEDRSRAMESYIQQYACVTPAVVANDLSATILGEAGLKAISQQRGLQQYDPFHQARIKLSIAFPDKRLLQYDCGKLQRLDKLLRQLQAGGHRALIFTQMTKVLDILEQFLNIHGHLYLRLDGATKIEQRQILTDRFNNDKRILCFILSSRSGGLGINLTGADTVIFYDLDWNPAMDKQCTDRAHRIGQTRDVHIYRFVSEHTIESNILRKASQKQMLDDVVIQEGDFTTDYLNKTTYKDMLEDGSSDVDNLAGAAMDRVLGGGSNEKDRTRNAAFEQAEDREDIAAARVAVREDQHADDGDFDDKPMNQSVATGAETNEKTLGPFDIVNTAIEELDDDDDDNNDSGIHHIDDYLLRLQRYLLKDVPLALSIKDRSKKGKNKKRGGDLRRR